MFPFFIISSIFAVQDIEVNDGSLEKPFYMSKDLMKILGKNNDPAVREAIKNRKK